MRHLKKGKKFGREKSQRKALMKSLATSLVLNEKIKTTEVKAKAVRPVVEKYITRAKKENLASGRIIAEQLHPRVVSKLIKDLVPRYKDRRGGYIRITKLGARKSDGASMAIIELVK
jgi:large subunit ribosomal protein L17